MKKRSRQKHELEEALHHIRCLLLVCDRDSNTAQQARAFLHKHTPRPMPWYARKAREAIELMGMGK